MTVRGKRGANQIRFFGRIRGRELPAGAYVLLIRRGSTPPQRVAVRVVEDGAQALSSVEASAVIRACTPDATTTALGRPIRFVGAATERVTTEEPERQPSPATAAPKPPAERPDDDPFRVLLPEIGSIPPDSGELPVVVGIAALAILGLAGLGMIVFLIRFFRSGSEL